MSMDKSTTTVKKTIFHKLIEITEAIDAVEKKGHNDYSDYYYVRATDMARIFRKEFTTHNLSWVMSVKEILPFNNESGRQKNGVRVIAEITIRDLDTGESLTFSSVGEGVDSGDKAVYKAMTGAMKYALRNLFMVPDEKGDPEADEGGSVPDDRQPERKKGPQRVQEPEDESQERPDDDSLISEAQRKRLFAIARAANPEGNEADIKDVVKKVIKTYGFNSTHDITRGEKYDKIVAEVGGDKLKVRNAKKKGHDDE